MQPQLYESISHENILIYENTYSGQKITNCLLIKKEEKEENRVNQAFPTVACVDSLDWKELSSKEITERVLQRVKPGSIMLFHNGVKNTPEALEQILKKLKDDGYKVVTVSDMIYKNNFTVDHTGRQIKN